MECGENMEAYSVVIFEQDGSGGSKEKEFWFKEYDDAHRFYAHIKSLKGTSFHPSIKNPPTLKTVAMPKIHGPGELTEWESRKPTPVVEGAQLTSMAFR